MLVRVAITCALVWGVVALEAGSAASAVSGAGPGKLLRGRTSQQHPVRFVVKPGKLDLIRFVARLRCSDGTILTDYESGFEPTPLHGRRLRDHQSGSTDDVFIRGRVGKNRVEGMLRVKDTLNHGKVRCDSRWFKFSAHAGG